MWDEIGFFEVWKLGGNILMSRGIPISEQFCWFGIWIIHHFRWQWKITFRFYTVIAFIVNEKRTLNVGMLSKFKLFRSILIVYSQKRLYEIRIYSFNVWNNILVWNLSEKGTSVSAEKITIFSFEWWLVQKCFSLLSAFQKTLFHRQSCNYA